MFDFFPIVLSNRIFYVSQNSILFCCELLPKYPGNVRWNCSSKVCRLSFARLGKTIQFIKKKSLIMFSGKKCSINVCNNVFSYLLQVELNGLPRNICFWTFPGWRLEHYSASCAFPDDQDENMSIAFYPAIHRSRDIYAVGTQSILAIGAIKPPRFNKKDFSFANLRISTLRFPLTPSADREGPQ